MGFFFSHLAGGEPKKSLHERGEGRKQAHLWLCQPHLRSPITIPPGKVWQRERDKGRRERERKEEIVGEIYRPLQQLTEGWVNLLLIICTQNKLDWWWWKKLPKAAVGFLRAQTTTYLPWWHRTICVCRMYECKQQQQQQQQRSTPKHTHRNRITACGYKPAET